MKTTEREASARIGTALAHPLRLAILEILVDGPHIVTELIDRLGEPQPVVSKHLATLRAAGLLDCEPDGRCRLYRLADTRAMRRTLAALGSLAASAKDCIDAAAATR